MLIEALIALLIFSVGILGIVGLQASAVNTSADAKYRSEAALLANELIGRMWVSDRTQLTLANNFKGGDAAQPNATPDGPLYQQWAWLGMAGGGSVANPAAGTVFRTLPRTGVNGVLAPPPRVLIAPIPGALASTNQVTITIFWIAPHENVPHRYDTQVQIGG
jgi:type IV pilus assembly protein PilV